MRIAQAWWRRHRTKAPRAITEELARVRRLLAHTPDAGEVSADLEGVWMLPLPRVRFVIYDQVIHEHRRVGIVAFWHAQKESPPRA